MLNVIYTILCFLLPLKLEEKRKRNNLAAQFSSHPCLCQVSSLSSESLTFRANRGFTLLQSLSLPGKKRKPIITLIEESRKHTSKGKNNLPTSRIRKSNIKMSIIISKQFSNSVFSQSKCRRSGKKKISKTHVEPQQTQNSWSSPDLFTCYGRQLCQSLQHRLQSSDQNSLISAQEWTGGPAEHIRNHRS